MSEKGPVYPGTLDVVDYGGSEYQVVASVQTNDPNEVRFLLKNIATGEVIRIKGAIFNPQITRIPGVGDVHRRGEGVRVTGLIEGGEIE